MASITSALGGGNNLGTLIVRLAADGTALTTGMEDGVKTVSKGSAAMVTALAAVAAAVAALGAAAVREFAKFNEAMVQSTAIMGKLSSETKKEMENVARSLAMEGVVSAENLAKAYYSLGSAGLSAQQSMKALPIVARFATAGNTDAAKATELLTGAQAALNLSMQDPMENMENMARLADLLTTANNLANGSLVEFAQALANKSAASIKDNVSTEEGIALLAVLAKQNHTGMKAGEEASILLTDLANKSVLNRDAFRSLGVTIFDTSSKMRPLVDIMTDFDATLGRMSPEMRAVTYEQLGFERASQDAMKALLGHSGLLKEFTAGMKGAGGATKEVADNQLQSFNAQMTIAWHRLQDVGITIGEVLVPYILKIIQLLKDATGDGKEFTENLKFMADVIGNGLVLAVKTVLVIFDGWKKLFQVLAVAALQFASIMLTVFEGIAKTVNVVLIGISAGFQGMVNGVIAGLNALIRLLPEAAKELSGITEMDEVDFASVLNIDGSIDKIKEWQGIVGDAQKDLIDRFTKTGEYAMVEIEKTSEKISDKTVDAFHEIGNAADLEMKRIRGMIDSSNIAMSQLLDKMGASNNKDFEGNFIGMSPTEMQLGVKGVGSNQDQMGMEFLQNQHQQELNEKKIAAIESMNNREAEMGYQRLLAQGELSKQEIKMHDDLLKRKAQALELYSKQTKALQTQQNQLYLTAASSTFDSLSSIAKTWGGEQSAMYKAMFAASKAFAIAESTIKIMTGIAEAAGTPWPGNIFAMAQVAAATASIVSNISAVTLSFGGGKAIGGPVNPSSFYMVGEKGPELFRPNGPGTIIPNDKIGGTKTSVIVNVLPGETAAVEERDQNGEKVIEITVKRVKDEIASEVRDGRGPVNRAIQETFNLRRGTRQ